MVLVIKTWTYAGTGYITAPGAELAAASAARARERDGQASTCRVTTSQPTEGEAMNP